MKRLKRLPGLQAVALLLLAASAESASAPKGWFVNAQGGAYPVHFSVKDDEQQSGDRWFGWVWSEGNQAPPIYPGSTAFNLKETLAQDSAIRFKKAKATDLEFPALGMGPGRELWLLVTAGVDPGRVSQWEELLDTVESAYRQVINDPRAYRIIGKLGPCRILSAPLLESDEGSTVGWRPHDLKQRAPEGVDQSGYEGSGAAKPVRVYRFLRWLDGCNKIANEANLRLFPIFTQPDRYFFEVTGTSVQILGWRRIDPAGWTSGTRKVADFKVPEAEEIELSESELAGDLCKSDKLKKLCQDEALLRQRLYIVQSRNDIPIGPRQELLEKCKDFLGRDNCGEKSFAADVAGAPYRRNFIGTRRVSSNPVIQSTMAKADGPIQWMVEPELKVQQGKSELNRLGGPPISLLVLPPVRLWKKPWFWLLVILALLFIGLRVRRIRKSTSLSFRAPRERWEAWRQRAIKAASPLDLLTQREIHLQHMREAIDHAQGDHGLEIDGKDQQELGIQIGILRHWSYEVLEHIRSLGDELRRVVDVGAAREEAARQELGVQVEILRHWTRELLEQRLGSLSDELRQDLNLETVLGEALGQIRDAGEKRVQTARDAFNETASALNTLQATIVSRIAGAEEAALDAVASQKDEVLSSARGTLETELAGHAVTALKEARGTLLQDLHEDARGEISKVVDERWKRYAVFFEQTVPMFEDKARLEQALETLRLFDSVPHLATAIAELSRQLPFEGFLSAVAPDHLSLLEDSRRLADEHGRAEYVRIRQEIERLEPRETNGSFQKGIESLGQLGLWIRSIWSALRPLGTLRDIVDPLPEVARQEWLGAFRCLRSFELVDAPTFRRLARGIRNEESITEAELSFLRSCGLSGTTDPVMNRLQTYLIRRGEPGRLGDVSLALQYLIEAFPREHIAEKARRSEFEHGLRTILTSASLPTDLHALIASAAEGVGFRYRPVPYYRSRVDDSRFDFIGRMIGAIDLAERVGVVVDPEPYTIVRLDGPFFFVARDGVYYSGRACIARQ